MKELTELLFSMSEELVYEIGPSYVSVFHYVSFYKEVIGTHIR